jgi:hypothetical protein
MEEGENLTRTIQTAAERPNGRSLSAPSPRRGLVRTRSKTVGVRFAGYGDAQKLERNRATSYQRAVTPLRLLVSLLLMSQKIIRSKIAREVILIAKE